VTVSNPPGGGTDTTPPTVSITSPASGVWTGNSINITASASDNVQLSKIDFWGNGGVFGTINCSSATCSGLVTWITGPLPPAAYQVQAVATDTAGNATVSSAITINKDATSPTVPSGAGGGGGGTDTTPPTVSITSPASGVWTGNSIDITASASDNVRLSKIDFWGNGGVFGTITCSSATCSGLVTWITGPLPPAAYQVHAVATDTSGNRTRSASIIINKDATSPLVPSGAP
jgi:Big-like domain-containing protein